MKGKYGMSIFSRYSICFLSLVMLLTSCGQGLRVNGNTPETNAPVEISTGSTTDEKEIKGDLELQIFVGGYGREFWDEAIEAFKQEYPDVNVIAHLGGTVNVELTPRWFSGNPPDFAFQDGPNFPDNELLQQGKLADLTDWFATSKTSDGSSLIKDNIYNGLIDEIEGKIYSAPYIFGALGMWYNARLFRDNNLKVPTNFEEFINLAAELKPKNIALMNYPGQFPNYLYLGFLRQNLAIEGGQQLLTDVYKLKPGVFLSESFKRSMNKIEILSGVDNAILESSFNTSHLEAQKEWLQGKSAFIPNGLWLENEMKGSIPNDFEMTFIPSLIQDKGQKYVICAYSHNVCIAREAKNPEAAKAWLSFLYREDTLKMFTEKTGVPTAYKMDLSDANISDTMKKVQKWIADPTVTFYYGVEALSLATDTMYDCLNQILTKKMTANEACVKIQEAANKMAEENDGK